MVSENNLRKLRLREGITIAELSRAARLSPKTATKCERGLGGNSLTTRNRLVNALNELARGESYGFGDVFPEPGEPVPPPDGQPPKVVFTESLRRTLGWLTQNTEDLAPYEDKWVAICDGRIVASGEWPKDAMEAAAAAGHAGEETMYVFIGDDSFIY